MNTTLTATSLTGKAQEIGMQSFQKPSGSIFGTDHAGAPMSANDVISTYQQCVFWLGTALAAGGGIRGDRQAPVGHGR